MPTRKSGRSDAEIFVDARKALDQRPTVPQGVHVHVDRGAVKLTGSVRQPFERAMRKKPCVHWRGFEAS